MQLLDRSNPFYRPAGRRYAITAAPLIWSVVELSIGNSTWALFFGAIGVYLAWQLILTWPNPDSEQE